MRLYIFYTAVEVNLSESIKVFLVAFQFQKVDSFDVLILVFNESALGLASMNHRQSSHHKQLPC